MTLAAGFVCVPAACVLLLTIYRIVRRACTNAVSVTRHPCIGDTGFNLTLLHVLCVAFVSLVLAPNHACCESKTAAPKAKEEPNQVVVELDELKLHLRKSGSKRVRFDVTATLVAYDTENRVLRCIDKGRRLLGTIPDPSLDPPPKLGSLVRLRGVTQPGAFRVTVSQLDVVGTGTLPKPFVIPRSARSIEPRLIGLYCQLSGRIVEVLSQEDEFKVLLRTNGGDKCWVLHPSSMPWESAAGLLLQNARALGVVVDENSQREGPRKLVLSAMSKSQLRPGKLAEANPNWVKLNGQVIAKDSGNAIAVHSDEKTTWIHSKLSSNIRVGQTVIAYISPIDAEGSEKLPKARLIRLTQQEPLPLGVDQTITEVASAAVVHGLVRLRGKVQLITKRNGDTELRVNKDGNVFLAYVRVPINLRTKGIHQGSIVEVEGVHRRFAAGRMGPAKFKLINNDSSGIRLISNPVPIYAKQIGIAAICVSTMFILFAIWNRALRGKVRSRTRDAQKLANRLQASCDAICQGIFFFDNNKRLIQATGIANTLLQGHSSEGESIAGVVQRIAKQFRDPSQLAAFANQDVDLENKVRSDLVPDDVLPKYELQLAEGGGILSFQQTRVSQDGAFEGLIWIVEDVTIQRSLELKIAQTQKMKAIGQLAGGVAHDFNNLLMAISANLSVAQLNSANERTVQKHIEIATDAVGRAAELTRQLLGFSRKTSLTVQVAQLNDVVSKTAELFRHLLDPQIQFDISLDPNLSHVRIDVAQIEQVLLNLCLNAKDATSDGGSIHIRTTHLTDAKLGDCAVIEVEDDGVGIESELLQSIYEPFFTTKDVGEGSGLGLAMAFGIVNQHGGLIRCESTKGVGTCFQVVLPATAHTEENESASPREPYANTVTNDHCKRVLIVDDEPMIREASTALISSLGHESVCVDGGEHALEILESDSDFDLVLLDLTMPIMSGKEALGHIKSRFPDLRVVICTGYSVDAEAIAANRSMAPEAIMYKPVKLEEIRRVLDRAS